MKMRMDTLASVAILFCVVTVHQQAQQMEETQVQILQQMEEAQVHILQPMTAQRQNKQTHRADANASPKPSWLS